MEEDCKVIKFHARDNCALNQDCKGGDETGKLLFMNDYKKAARLEEDPPILDRVLTALRGHQWAVQNSDKSFSITAPVLELAILVREDRPTLKKILQKEFPQGHFSGRVFNPEDHYNTDTETFRVGTLHSEQIRRLGLIS